MKKKKKKKSKDVTKAEPDDVVSHTNSAADSSVIDLCDDDDDDDDDDVDSVSSEDILYSLASPRSAWDDIQLNVDERKCCIDWSDAEALEDLTLDDIHNSLEGACGNGGNVRLVDVEKCGAGRSQFDIISTR